MTMFPGAQMKRFGEVIQNDDKGMKIVNSLQKLGACIMVSAWKVVRFVTQHRVKDPIITFYT